jgi:hypothetical protein
LHLFVLSVLVGGGVIEKTKTNEKINSYY